MLMVLNFRTRALALMMVVCCTQVAVSTLSKVLNAYISTTLNTLFYYLIPFVFLLLKVFKHRKHYSSCLHTLYIVRAFFSVAAVLAFFYTSVSLNLSEANLLFTTAPLFLAIAANLLLNEKTSVIGFICIFIAFIGVYCIIRPNELISYQIAYPIGLASGLFMAVSQILLKFLVKKGEAVEKVVFYQYAYCTFLMVIIVVFEGIISDSNLINLENLSLKVICLLILVGVISLFGQSMMAKAFTYMDSSQLVPMLYVGVPISAFVGFVFWNQTFTPLFVLGTALICFGVSANIILKLKR